jgi:hypothetical protein
MDAASSGAGDRLEHLRIPPDMVDVDGKPKLPRTVGVEPVADVERLAERVHAIAVRGIHRVKRLDGQFHARRIGKVEERLDAILDLTPRGRDVLGGFGPRPGELR